ncbi:MAG: hypothetical protein PHT94_03915, partial [Candidatus Nanoarchaeia archaeon]|nr:hypothetical protein [Candidatus Nanoarchaeia archaeon]
MKIILPNQEIIVKYIEENKVSFEGQKGIVKNLPNDIKNNSFLKVKVTKIDPMRGFEAIFLSISNINNNNNNNNDSKTNQNDNTNRNNNLNKSNFNRTNSKEQKNNLIEKRLNEITEGNVGESFTIKVKILEIKQTKGPTIFVVYDGSRISIAKGFEKAGERAFPQINVGDKIKAEVRVSMFDNSVELSIKGYEFLSIKEDEDLIKNIELETEKKIKVNDWNFLIESETLKKMKPDFEKFAKTINYAIVDNKPIYLKHHADCDGLSAAMAIERAILKKMYEVYGDEMTIKHNYKRSLSKSPFYDYFDASRDTAMFLEDAAYFGTKAPLIIVVDFGSSTESLLSYKKLKSNGAQIIVLDHHQVTSQEKEILLEYVDIIVNST